MARALEDCRAAGKLRIAAYSGDAAALRYAIASGEFGSVQASVNLCDQESLPALREARACGLGTIAKRPLAGQPWRHAAPPRRLRARRVLAPLRGVARSRSYSMADWEALALRFAAYAPGVDCVIVGGDRSRPPRAQSRRSPGRATRRRAGRGDPRGLRAGRRGLAGADLMSASAESHGLRTGTIPRAGRAAAARREPQPARRSTSRCSPTHAQRVELCLFDAAGRETARLALPVAHRRRLARRAAGAVRRRGHAVRLPRARPLPARRGPSLQPGQAAGRSLRHRAGGRRRRGTRRCAAPNPATTGCPTTRDSAPYVPKCRVADAEFDWGGVRAPNVPWRDTIIYELHVKGFTQRHPGRAGAPARQVPRPRAARGARPPAQARRHHRRAACRCSRS